jgi:hypothetical protein
MYVTGVGEAASRAVKATVTRAPDATPVPFPLPDIATVCGFPRQDAAQAETQVSSVPRKVSFTETFPPASMWSDHRPFIVLCVSVRNRLITFPLSVPE